MRRKTFTRIFINTVYRFFVHLLFENHAVIIINNGTHLNELARENIFFLQKIKKIYNYVALNANFLNCTVTNL